MEISHLKAKNFGCFEDIDLNLSKQGLVWIGGENRDTKSASNNGSGKSTLLRALSWGLYNDTVDGEKTEKIVRQGEKSVSVEVELRDGKNKWVIKRSRTLKGNLNLSMTLPNGEQSKDSRPAMQKLIEELIGMDFFAFRNTVLYGQNDIVRFADSKTTDQQRKAMLFKILRTEILTDCHEIIKKRKKKIEDEIDRAGRELREAEIRIEEKDIKNVQRMSDDFEKQRAIQIHEYKMVMEESKKQARREMRVAEREAEPKIDLPSVVKRKKELDFLLSECNKAEDQLTKKQSEAQELDVDIGEMREALTIIKESKKSARRRLDKLGGDACPLCESNLKKGAPKKVVDKLDKEYDDLDRQKHVQEEVLYNLTQEKKALSEEVKRLTKQVRQRRFYLDEIEDIRQKMSDEEKRLDHAEQRREYHLKRAKDHLEFAKTQKVSIKRVKEMENPHIQRIDDLKEEIIELREDKKEIEKFIEQKSDELAHYRFWVHGFSNQGLPSFFLDSVMPFITNRANSYLQVLSDGDIVMNFTTQKELKSSKDVRDKIDIQWRIEGLPDSYPPSGGQLKKMSIATDLALMDLVSAREGDNINLLALDEVLDGLDDEGCERVVTLMTDLRKSKDTILVISHEPSMLDRFEKSLHVVKENGVSRLI